MRRIIVRTLSSNYADFGLEHFRSLVSTNENSNTGSKIKIGLWNSGTVNVESTGVSARHCQVEREDGRGFDSVLKEMTIAQQYVGCASTTLQGCNVVVVSLFFLSRQGLSGRKLLELPSKNPAIQRPKEH